MADTQPVHLTLGVPGESDVVLIELDNARGWLEAVHGLRMTRDEAALYLMTMGMAVLEQEGMRRATAAGAGLDPNWRPG